MDIKTIRDARKELASKGQILCLTEKAHAPLLFHLINIETGEPFPPEKGQSEIADYKPRNSTASLNSRKRAEPRALQTAKEPRVTATEYQPARQAQQPLGGSPALKTDGPEQVCPKHPNKKGYWDSSGWHCQLCEPSRYAPPEDAKPPIDARKQPQSAFRQPTGEELFGR
jgi:hypothetical protein